MARPPELKTNLLYVLIAEATNMGLVAMAESAGVSYDVLAWTVEWYFRTDTLASANAAIVSDGFTPSAVGTIDPSDT